MFSNWIRQIVELMNRFFFVRVERWILLLIWKHKSWWFNFRNCWHLAKLIYHSQVISKSHPTFSIFHTSLFSIRKQRQMKKKHIIIIIELWQEIIESINFANEEGGRIATPFMCSWLQEIKPESNFATFYGQRVESL